ncbi:(ABC) transporter [Tieghemiomyces parasiticus]|uniref:(ABC) transporter n=1 Tax=Tieghemiomyces parasiticus TaxID=78921 RepID=A0A9W7ZZI7_9FUNG|nr:(ABC) transporter [Tieghemiomyces parasiticus]
MRIQPVLLHLSLLLLVPVAAATTLGGSEASDLTASRRQIKLKRALLDLERRHRGATAPPSDAHADWVTQQDPALLPKAPAAGAPAPVSDWQDQVPFPAAPVWEREMAAAAAADKDKDCPPCFNCLLPAYKCTNYGNCSEYSGRCECPAGFGGDDCAEPVCDSLAAGEQRKVREGDSCDCTDGWDGINCNVCQQDRVCDAMMPEGINGTCYKGGLVVKENFQMCNVTNRKIVDMLPGEPPQVTFACQRDAATCSFQFWIKELESFYCQLSDCEFSENRGYDHNDTFYQCNTIECSCMAGRKLCGEDGSIDISDFLTEEIAGPASFECRSASGCRFEEPAMNELILSVFGDAYITLECDSGECLHYSQVPGFEPPPKSSNGLVIFVSVLFGVGFVIAAGFTLLYLAKARPGFNSGYVAVPADDLDDDERDKLMAQHVEATLSFKDVQYTVHDRTILYGVNGIVRPGEIMAILGASGAGKTTFLDILARRNKSGTVHGEVLVNGQVVDDEEFKRVVGFVDQEDTLMSTLTVYETILYSALLRLPRDMSRAAKRARVLETMRELGIMHIKDSRIGSSTERGISGGEKRRVSIACELVTSPSILFLDEPTSGLDSYNAYNVVECLVNLARTYNRTIVFTIHQPRSNIFALFDQLVLLAEGYMVYSGPASRTQFYFEGIGHACPLGFNIADFIVDLTKHASRTEEHRRRQLPASQPQQERTDSAAETAQEVSSSTTLGRPRLGRQLSIGEEQAHRLYSPQTPATPRGEPDHQPSFPDLNAAATAAFPASDRDEVTPLRTSRDPEPLGDEAEVNPWRSSQPARPATTSSLEAWGTQLWSRLSNSHQGPPDPPATATPEGADLSASHLLTMVGQFRASDNGAELLREIGQQRATEPWTETDNGGGEDGTAAASSSLSLGAPSRPSWATQFTILADRTFKNLCRDPLLLLTHYLISVLLAVFCGVLFYQVTDDIAGFQNRLGIFFFLCALFGFSCLTSLQTFSTERILFMRERANGYYAPLTYFCSKVVFDIFPLRVIPPFLFGLIIYPMVGLVPGVEHFARFVTVLVLFNLAAASICLCIGILCRELSVANLLSSLIMLFSMLFGGLLLNKESIPFYLRFFNDLSVFNYALEAMIVNEVKYLQLREKKFGLEIDVPGATILSTFGFNALNYWPDVARLAGMFLAFLVVAFIGLQFLVKERR